jgi:hypothetical protein
MAMTKSDNSGRSNLVELLGLLVATVGLFVTLSDKWHPDKPAPQAPIEQERREAPRRKVPSYEEEQRSSARPKARSFKRQDRLMPSKWNDERLPRY